MMISIYMLKMSSPPYAEMSRLTFYAEIKKLISISIE